MRRRLFCFRFFRDHFLSGDSNCHFTGEIGQACDSSCGAALPALIRRLQQLQYDIYRVAAEEIGNVTQSPHGWIEARSLSLSLSRAPFAFLNNLLMVQSFSARHNVMLARAAESATVDWSGACDNDWFFATLER